MGKINTTYKKISLSSCEYEQLNSDPKWAGFSDLNLGGCKFGWCLKVTYNKWYFNRNFYEVLHKLKLLPGTQTFLKFFFQLECLLGSLNLSIIERALLFQSILNLSFQIIFKR